MTTVINNPRNNENPTVVQPVIQNSGVGPIVAIVIAAVFVVLFFVYGLPAIRDVRDAKSGGINVDVTLPTPAPAATTPASAPEASGY